MLLFPMVISLHAEFGIEDGDPDTAVSNEDAPCVSTADAYECSCNGHYSGNGKVSVDAPECDSDDVTANK